jgi:D-alanyl-D-alanine carboxypeptidase
VENKYTQQTGATKIQSLYIVCALVCVILCGVLIAKELSLFTKKQDVVVLDEKIVTTGSPKPKYDRSAFENLEIRAESFIVYDLLSKEIIAEKNADTVFPLASITKVMTALIAYKHISQDVQIKITASDLDIEGDSGLELGDVWSRDELIKFMLSVSSNDGAHALARVAGMQITNSLEDEKNQRQAFIEQMNTFSQDKGLTTFAFKNESGLDISESQFGGVGSAKDAAKLFETVYFTMPELFESTTKSIDYVQSNEGTHVARNTNRGASAIPGLTASKTGYTDAALGNLGVVVDIGLGRPIVIVALHSGKESRFTDVEKLYRATVQAMK